MTEARSLLPTYIASAAQTHVIRGPLSCASAVGYLEAARGRARATMFSTTFLGHQGWLFQTKGSCVLVDPLLCEDFGQTQALGYRVYPPRILKPDQFPRVSAVVLTHEHDDHFDIPSLAQLDRAIPIFLSSRSSTAAREILREMGFQPHPLVPGRKLAVGDIELTPFCGDHVAIDCGDEWDTLPFFVRDAKGAGNFFSMVDITLTEQHVEWARSLAPRPVLVGWTNNALDWSHMGDYLAERVNATQDCFVKMGVGHKLIAVRWGAPSAMLMCAGGFSFHGEKEWLNQHVFCVDTEAVCEKMAALYPKEKFFATRPGQTFQMEAGGVKRVVPDTSFLTTPRREAWPSRARSEDGKREGIPDYAPATGRREIAPEDREALREGLGGLAASLVGGTIFKGLCSLLEDAAPGRTPTFAVVLRHGEDDARLVFEYVPSACAFTRVEPALSPRAPRETYLAGIECWATDFLAVLRGELGPIALTFGRSRLWNALPERFRFDLFGELYRVSHPLRRPAETFRMYQREWSKNRGVTPVILAR
jgi:hypothetical protein